ncbi:RNA methyltransferase [Zhurongbacter thermophilus]
MEKLRLHIALLHYPMYGKNYQTIATSVTNLDIHDIARLARTYNLASYWVITPIEPQRAMVQRVVDYWVKGPGGGYNPHRKEALSLVRIGANVEEMVKGIEEEFGGPVKLFATDARPYPNMIDYEEARRLLREDDAQYVLVLGTGHGIVYDEIRKMDYFLKPIRPNTSFNHLSVRSAASILVDRLVGEEWSY